MFCCAVMKYLLPLSVVCITSLLYNNNNEKALKIPSECHFETPSVQELCLSLEVLRDNQAKYQQTEELELIEQRKKLYCHFTSIGFVPRKNNVECPP